MAVALLSGLFASLPTLAEADAEPSAESLEFFEKRVRPLLADKCLRCHGAEQQKGELRLDSRAAVLKGGESGPAIVPGHPEQSLLVEAVLYEPTSYRMPPTGKLSDDAINVLTEWIRQGAAWPTEREPVGSEGGAKEKFNLAERADFWSFRPLARVTPPPVKQRDWPQNPIDQFLLARLEAEGLKPARPAEKTRWARRVYLELIGLPPTAEQLAEFEADSAPDAESRLVEQLLASPHYGERWGRHWLDLMRYAETGGHEFDFAFANTTPYRDYVIRAWNDDLPYPQFVTEHLAGDLLSRPRRDPLTQRNESAIATAFFWLGQRKHSPVDLRSEECDVVDNQLDVVGKAFLGLTIACARCHDHKFDPILQADYYALAGYLQSSRFTYTDLNPPEATQAVVREISTLDRQSASRLRNTAGGSRLAVLEGRVTPDVAATAAENTWPASWSQPPAGLLPPADGLWKELLQASDDQQWSAAKGRWLAHAAQPEQFAKANHQVRVWFAGTETDFGDWRAEGHAFGPGPAMPGTVIGAQLAEDPASVRVVEHPQLHSGLVAGRLQGTIRSPTFTVTQRFLDYRVARFGGQPQPGRSQKNGQVHFIVDGFQMIQHPLHGGLSINVPNDGQVRVIRQDLSRYLGRSGYIEIEDVDDGWIVVDQIVATDGPQPPVELNERITSSLRDAEITTLTQWRERFRRETTGLLARWVAGTSNLQQTAADWQLLNWLLGMPSQSEPTTTPTDSGDWPAYITARQSLIAKVPVPTYSVATTDGSAENEHLLVRGNPHKSGEEVTRRFLTVFEGTPVSPAEPGSGRLALAERFVDGSNPLAARVIVNRLWQHHFGRGLVATPDDFGHMGLPPSHPELLDWLATELIRREWSLKSIQRLITTSAAYRMSSRNDDPLAEQRDPQNLLLHRMNLQRLEGEAIRDSLLVLGGELDDQLYGPSVMPHLTPFMEGRGRPAESGPLNGKGRRSVYISVRRNFLSPLFLAFDFPTPFTTVGRRSTSNVPAQGLTMLNNPFVVHEVNQWTQRLASQGPATSRPPAPPRGVAEEAQRARVERIQRMYREVFARAPADEELRSAEEFLEAQATEYGALDERAWRDLSHVLVNLKEFLFVP